MDDRPDNFRDFDEPIREIEREVFRRSDAYDKAGQRRLKIREALRVAAQLGRELGRKEASSG